MPKEKTKVPHSFSLRITTLERIRKTAVKAKLAGGQSAIVEDAVTAWLNRYEADPDGWLAARGVAVASEPENDDL